MSPKGIFKLPYSLSIPYHKLPKLFDESNTQEVEEHIARLFGSYLLHKENKNVGDWFINPNDEHKGADVIGEIEGKSVGIQITQFVLNNYLSRFNQAKKLCLMISDEISRKYIPPIDINVQIFGSQKRKDIIPIASKKVFKKLSRLIAEKIEENIQVLSNNPEYLNFWIEDIELRKITQGFNLIRIPPMNYSSYFGNGKVFIDYGFDDIYINDGDLQKEAERIFERKNDGKAEILLIWSDTKQLMDKGNEACEILRKVFEKESSFESIYFISFLNIKDLQRRQVYLVKIK